MKAASAISLNRENRSLRTSFSPDSVASTKTDVLSTQAVRTAVQSQTATHLLNSTRRHVQLTSNLSLHMYQPPCHIFQLKTRPSDSNLAQEPNYNAMRHNSTSLSREPSQTNCQSSQQPVNTAHNPSLAEEFGHLGGQGSLVRRTLADEILTPDTSKYIPGAYETQSSTKSPSLTHPAHAPHPSGLST